VTDKLMELFMNELITRDNIYTSTKYSPEIHKNIKTFSDFCENKCKLYPIQSGVGHKELMEYATGWMGPKKRLFFVNITTESVNLETLFPDIRNIDKINYLWNLFWEIDDKILRSKDTIHSTELVKQKTTEFLNKFTEIYHTSKITPYIHFLSFHLHEQYEKYGNLNYFSAQGLEKLNDFSTYQFFSSTNKNKNFIKQMLEKDFRIALLEESFEF